MATTNLSTLTHHLPIVGPISPLPRGSSEDSLLIKALSILKQLDEMNILSPEKIISCKEMYNMTGPPSVYYELYGERFFAYLDLIMKLDCVRTRYFEAAKTMPPDIDSYAIQSAIIHEERIGRCGELSHETHLLAKKAGLFGQIMILTGEPLHTSTGSFTNNHGLVLVSDRIDSLSDEKILEALTPAKGNFIKTMKGLSNVVVIDPYLNTAVRGTEIESHPEFISLLTALKVSDLAEGILMKSTIEATIALRTTLIAQVKVMGPLVEREMLESEEFIRLKRRNLIITKLEGIFPITAGRWKKNDNSIFFIGSKTAIIEISEKLRATEIPNNYAQVKGKEDYCLIIDIHSYFGTKQIYETISAME
jgi:hypothetical protein